mgnify:CR=1 FL=1
MNYERLVREGAIERISTSDGEIADHIRKARHDIAVAQNVTNIDLDWAFTIAYNGILQVALGFMYSKGYRPKGEAKHYNTFRFLQEVLPASYSSQIARLQKLRKKRNRAVYQQMDSVSEKEAKDIISFSARFLEEISEIMPEKIIEQSRES